MTALVARLHSRVGIDILSVVMASILISLAGLIAIPLPFSPVPIALQPQLVLFFAAIMGSKRGALAVVGFLAQGAMGLPVFACGKSGALHLLGPTGGYLIGYVVAAFLVGWIFEREREKRVVRDFLTLCLGMAVIYTLGVMQLSHFISFKQAVLCGVLPFIPGALLKNLFFTGMLGPAQQKRQKLFPR